MKIKYAVYKGAVGLYAKEYFDKIDPELFNDRGVLGWQRIIEEDLPIVVNASGGRCSFYPVEDNFVEICYRELWSLICYRVSWSLICYRVSWSLIC